MKKKLLVLVLALVLVLSLSVTAAFAADYSILPSVTTKIDDFQFTATNIADVYYHETDYHIYPGSPESYDCYFFFCTPEATCTINTTLLLFPKEPWVAMDVGTVYDGEGVGDIPAGKEFSVEEQYYPNVIYKDNYFICFLDMKRLDDPDYTSKLLPISGLAAAQQPAVPLVAKPTASTVLVNGENVAFDAYNILDNNYFKLRDLAFILSGTEKQFEVGWDAANNAISLTSGKEYTVAGGEMTGKGAGNKTPVLTNSKIYLDGEAVEFTAYNIEGNNYFKLRDIGEAFDFGITWDGAKNTIVIDTSVGYTVE